MNVIIVFVAVFFTCRAFCSTIVEILKNEASHPQFHPVFIALLTGPDTTFKDFVLSQYGDMLILDSEVEGLIYDTFSDCARDPSLAKEANNALVFNLVNNPRFPLLKNSGLLLETFLKYKRDGLGRNIATFIDKKACEYFKWNLLELFDMIFFLRKADFKRLLTNLFNDVKLHFSSSDVGVLKDLEIIENSCLRLICFAIKNTSFQTFTCLSDYIGFLADQIVSRVNEVYSDESFNWVYLSDLPKRIRVISHALDRPSSYSHLKDGWDESFMNFLSSVYSDLLKKEFLKVPVLGYPWKAIDGESPYLKVPKTRFKAFQLYVNPFNHIETIQDEGRNVIRLVFDEAEKIKLVHKISHKLKEFQNEREICKHLDHPYFIKSHGHFFDYSAQSNANVFEYIDGMRSDEYAKTATKEQLTRIAAQLFLALEYLHAIGFVHGDIKPANVMVTNDGMVKIIDFGFSFKSPGTRKHVGTPMTMAPELCNLVPGELHEAVDWWAYGATLSIWFGLNPEFNAKPVSNFVPLIFKSDKDTFVFHRCPSKFPGDLRHFLAIFFQPDPECRRLNTPRQLQKIRNNPFFNGIDWSELEGGIIEIEVK